MRRLLAYISMVLSLLVVVLFNAQSVYLSNNLGLEYQGGREAVLQFTKRDDGADINVDELSKTLSQRLDLAGASDYRIEVVGDSTEQVQMRVKLPGRDQNEFENIMRIVKSNTNLTFTNANNDEIDGATLLGSQDEPMILNYSGVTPQPYFVIGDIEAYNNFIANNENIADEEVKNNIYVWENKLESDTYELAFGDDPLESVTSKVIATLTIDDYTFDEANNRGLISVSTLEDGSAFSIASARSYVNARNAQDYNCTIEYLYDNSILASMPSQAQNLAIIGGAVGLGLILLALCLLYGLSGFSAGLALSVTVLFTLLVGNFVGFLFTPSSVSAIYLSLAIGSGIICFAFEKVKMEAKRGKALNKAHFEGFRKATKMNWGINLTVFALSLIVFFIGQASLKSFGGFMTLGAIFNVLASFYLTKWMTYCLVNSSKLTSHLNLVGLAHVENSKKEKIVEKLSISKDKLKKRNIASAVTLGVIGLLSLGTFLGFGLTGNLYNNTDSYSSGYRVDITYKTERSIQDDDTFLDFQDFLDNVTASGEDIGFDASDVVSSTFNRFETVETDYAETYTTYISFALDHALETGQRDALINYVTAGFGDLAMIPGIYQEDTNCTYNITESGNIQHMNFYYYLEAGMVVCFAILIYLLFFGIYAAMQVGLVLAGELGLGLSIVTLFQLPFTSYTLFGIILALIVTSIIYLPIYSRFRELKKDGKNKYPTEDMRIAYMDEAYKNSSISTFIGMLAALIMFVLTIAFIGTEMLTASIVGIVLVVFAFIYYIFFAPYNYIGLRRKIHFKPIKIQRKKKKPVVTNTNEPMETIIPGIND